MSRYIKFIVFVVALIVPSLAAADNGKFSASGLSDSQVHNFFLQLKAAVNEHDVKKIASMVSYPLLVNGKGSVKNPTDFIFHYSAIFTDKVVNAINQQSYGKLWGNYQGMMIGNGELWFAGICSDRSCSKYVVKITSINNG